MNVHCSKTWAELKHQTNNLLKCAGLPALSDADALLLYIVIITLYDEGIRPTYSEIHHKLRGKYRYDNVREYKAKWPQRIIVAGNCCQILQSIMLLRKHGIRCL